MSERVSLIRSFLYGALLGLFILIFAAAFIGTMNMVGSLVDSATCEKQND